MIKNDIDVTVYNITAIIITVKIQINGSFVKFSFNFKLVVWKWHKLKYRFQIILKFYNYFSKKN